MQQLIICPYCRHEYRYRNNINYKNLDSNELPIDMCPNCDEEFILKMDFVPHFDKKGIFLQLVLKPVKMTKRG